MNVSSLPPGRRRVWSLLKQSPGMSTRDMGSALGITPQAVSQHLVALGRDGLASKPARRWVAMEPRPWLPMHLAPHDGTELLLLCPSDEPHKVVFGAYRVVHGRDSLPAWRERYTGFVVEPEGFMHMPEEARL